MNVLAGLATVAGFFFILTGAIGILRLPYGKTLYTRSFPNVGTETGTEEGAIRGIDFELWQDDGSEKFEQLYARLEKEGAFLEDATD